MLSSLGGAVVSDFGEHAGGRGSNANKSIFLLCHLLSENDRVRVYAEWFGLHCRSYLRIRQYLRISEEECLMTRHFVYSVRDADKEKKHYEIGGVGRYLRTARLRSKNV